MLETMKTILDHLLTVIAETTVAFLITYWVVKLTRRKL